MMLNSSDYCTKGAYQTLRQLVLIYFRILNFKNQYLDKDLQQSCDNSRVCGGTILLHTGFDFGIESSTLRARDLAGT